jgi:hypothetical protein
MPLVTIDAYRRLIASRPYKFSADEVDYREADGEENCGNCLHLYKRAWDKYGVCEIFRDGEEFPLLKSTDKTSVPRHED